jgi:hypothetical protein
VQKKHSSLLRDGTTYGRKKFYGVGPMMAGNKFDASKSKNKIIFLKVKKIET